MRISRNGSPRVGVRVRLVCLPACLPACARAFLRVFVFACAGVGVRVRERVRMCAQVFQYKLVHEKREFYHTLVHAKRDLSYACAHREIYHTRAFALSNRPLSLLLIERDPRWKY